MNDGNALSRAIIARPEDDTPRLVYADWLEENGREEEAEFIRVECRLERASPDVPEFSELQDRREELRLWLQTHVPGPQVKWNGKLELRGGREWWRWTSRGFPRFFIWKNFEGEPRSAGIKRIKRLCKGLESAFDEL